MPINFPVNPSLNDVFSVGGVSYRWNGVKWVVVTYAISGGPTGPTGSTGPTGPQPDLGVVSVDVLPSSDLAFDLGASDARWRDLYLSGSSIFLGDAVLSSSDGGLSIASSAGGSVAFLTASDAASFATAAQGSLADSAVQPSDSIVVGDGGTIGSVSATDAITIDSNGNVGIGTSSPIYQLHVNGGNPNDTSSTVAKINTGDVANKFALLLSNWDGAATTNGIRILFDNSGQATWSIGGESAGTSFVFENGTTERMRITSDGYLRMASGSGGIQFGGDTSAANALDDYEEGTWAPTVLSGGFTGISLSSSARARYTKIGDVVTFSVDGSLQGTGDANIFQIGGLPYQCATNGWAACATYFQVLNQDNRNLSALVPSGQSYIIFNINPSGTAETATGNDFGSGYINVSGFYRI